MATDRRLTRRQVQDHLRGGGRQAALLLGDYVCLASGGSSGQRGVFVQTIAEYADMAASQRRDAIARQLAAGRSPDGMVIAMVAANSFACTEGLVGHSEPGEPVLTFAGGWIIERLRAPHRWFTGRGRNGRGRARTARTPAR